MQINMKMKLLQTIKIINILKCLSNRSFLFSFEHSSFLTQHIAPYCTGSLGQFFAQKSPRYSDIRHYQVRHPLTTPPQKKKGLKQNKNKKKKQQQKTYSVTIQQTTAIGILNVVHVQDQWCFDSHSTSRISS